MYNFFLWDSSCSTVLVNKILVRYISVEEANLKIPKAVLPPGQIKRIFCTHLKN